MTPKEKEIMVKIIQVGLLEKFLNDPHRMGMTEKQQKERLDAIEAISK